MTTDALPRPKAMDDPREAGSKPVAWEVSALLLALSDQMAARFGAVSVRGELSGITKAASGHWYFSLRDAHGADALLRCVMFRRATALVDFAASEGQRVEVRGRLSLYEPRGDLQFVAESMRRQGAGSLYEEFLLRRDRLAAQGLFDPARKRPLVQRPRGLGVVTSLGAAALRDVLTALARRAPHVAVYVYPTLVQGPDAPASIAQAMQLAGERSEVDTLLLVRGGGSLEDLWAFNDERVVRAIVSSPIPVVVGVGHETDITLADLAADLRAPTPTAAAELAAPKQEDERTLLDQAALALRTRLRHALDRHAQRLDLLWHRVGVPGRVLDVQTQRLQGLQRRLQLAVAAPPRHALPALQSLFARMRRSASGAIAFHERSLDQWTQRLAAVHPAQVLERGYAWVVDDRGRPVMRAAALQAGSRIEAVFSDGRAQALVNSVLTGKPTLASSEAQEPEAKVPESPPGAN